MKAALACHHFLLHPDGSETAAVLFLYQCQQLLLRVYNFVWVIGEKKRVNIRRKDKNSRAASLSLPSLLCYGWSSSQHPRPALGGQEVTQPPGSGGTQHFWCAAKPCQPPLFKHPPQGPFQRFSDGNFSVSTLRCRWKYLQVDLQVKTKIFTLSIKLIPLSPSLRTIQYWAFHSWGFLFLCF